MTIVFYKQATYNIRWGSFPVCTLKNIILYKRRGRPFLGKGELDIRWLPIIHCIVFYLVCADIKYASVMIQYGSGNFQVMLQDSEHSKNIQVILSGRIYLDSENITNHLPESTGRGGRLIGKNQFYNILERCGYSLGEEFSLIEDIQCHEKSTK